MTDVRPTVLVVEDDDMLVNMFKHMIRGNGMNIETSPDGTDAIHKMKLIPPPTVILLDLMMPNIDGFQVIEAFKAHWSWKNIPIVVFSNLSDPESRERALKLGAEEYMVKSECNPDDVIARIQEVIQRHNL